MISYLLAIEQGHAIHGLIQAFLYDCGGEVCGFFVKK